MFDRVSNSDPFIRAALLFFAWAQAEWDETPRYAMFMLLCSVMLVMFILDRLAQAAHKLNHMT